MSRVKPKLILALDCDYNQAFNLILSTHEYIDVYKIGLELLSYPYLTTSWSDIVSEIKSFNKSVFIDAKLHDIPTTVARATANLDKVKPDFITVHTGGVDILKAAKENTSAQILAVCQLTSGQVWFEDFFDKVHMAEEVGCGLIVPPVMVEMVRGPYPEMTIVTPAIRLDKNVKQDHSLAMTPEEAVKAGCDYIVVGRPIRDAQSPKDAAKEIASRLGNV